jgi:macrolide-specific efflux system membrane fusion protein
MQPTARQRGRAARRTGLWIAGSVSVLAALWIWAASRDGPASAQPGDGVPSVSVTRGPLEIVVAASGTFELQEYVDVGAQMSGQLRSVMVPLGAVVKRGQLVASIDDTAARARLAQTEASLASARAQIAAKQAQIDLARVQVSRNARLVERGFLSVATQDTTEATLASLEAEAESLKAQAASVAAVIEQAKTELKFSEVVAPIDGTVVSLFARPGQTLNATQQAPTILRIGDLRSLRLVANVSEADIVHIRPAMAVRLHLLGASEQSYAGKVREILPSPRLINSVVFYDVLVEPLKSNEIFRIGMTAQLFFLVARHDCMLKIPRNALPVDLRVPQRVTLTVIGSDKIRRPLSANVTAADDMHGGITCQDGIGLGLEEGAQVLLSTKGKSPKAGR